MARVRDWALPRMIERGGAITAWIIDDTGFPKKGKHSVGVARQYCGQLGKQDNCQVVVSLSIANEGASLPVAWQLYLPEIWADDPERRKKSKDSGRDHFSNQAADRARANPRHALDADAGGRNPCRRRLRRGRRVPARIDRAGPHLCRRRTTDTECLASRRRAASAQGVERKGPAAQADATKRRSPTSFSQSLAENLPADAWQTVTWREGSNVDLASRFAAVRLRVASRDYNLRHPRDEEWFLVEWPEDDKEPLKYWLSTLPETTPLQGLVATTKQRWRIERDYRELKQELGLGHYEGRGWRGFHHHASLCIAAYGFLLSERETIPPSALPHSQNSEKPPIPRGSRSSEPTHQARTPHLKFDRDAA